MHKTVHSPRCTAAAFALLLSCLCGTTGCSLLTHLGTDLRGESLGKTFYVGGAGPFGLVGTLDVPDGLRDGDYIGGIEVVGWQSWFGGTLRDQMDRRRNEAQAGRLAREIEEYLERYPGSPVNIIALSAGTGIAAWALENLSEEYRVGAVVFLGSSLSRQYDLSAALARIDGRLYAFYSPRDPVLRYGVTIAGSVDREFQGPNVAGLYGFALPPDADDTTRALYDAHVRNRPWRRAYARSGYRGLHTDATSPAFIARFVAPLLVQVGRAQPDEEEPSTADELEPTSQPGSRPVGNTAGGDQRR